MKELMIDLDYNAKAALYEQIYHYIKRDIIGGRLSRGERLPSSRLLASNLQVSRNTVEAAYAQLVSEGYLETKRGSGHYVCDIAFLYDFTRVARELNPSDAETRHARTGIPESKPQYAGMGNARNGIPDSNFLDAEARNVRNGILDSKPQYAGIGHARDGIPDSNFLDAKTRNTLKGIPDLNPLDAKTRHEINFLPGQIDCAAFPYNAWRKCSREALLEMENGLLLAGHPQGEYGLRETITAYLYQARGVRCIPQQLVIGAGNEYLLQLLGQVLGHPQSVAMESPTYLQAYYTFRNMGDEVLPVQIDIGGMQATHAGVPQGATLVYAMPSHQFPLGSVMPLKRRMQILAWADGQPGRYIIEDDHDSEFRYKGKPIPSLHSMAQQDSVIYLGTFSNSIMPSMRISYMVLPMGLFEDYQKRCGFYASTVSRIQQATVCKFMQAGYFERHLNKMRGVYKSKHDALLAALKGKKWVRKVYGSHAGLHMVVECDCDLSEEEILKRAAVHGLKIEGMSHCYIGQKSLGQNPILLLGFGGLSELEIREGVSRLEECVCAREL